MDKKAKIYVAGHRGMAGSAILRKLEKAGYTNFILKTSKELDLRNQEKVNSFFKQEKPEYVFLAAAKVGGIIANNTYKAEFLYDNLTIQSNVIHNSFLYGVTKLLFLGSSCIYPKHAPQPLKEEYLLTGELEPTNEPYAIAKIAGIKMCDAYRSQYGCNFISAMPTNLYGPNDNYNLETSHVLPALIRKMYLGKALATNDWNAIRRDLNLRPIESITGSNSENEIKFILKRYGINNDSKDTTITLWGTGEPLREFLHVDDLANACFFLMQNFNDAGFVNVGTGKDLSIKDLAEMIKNILGYTGKINWDITKPDGTPRKLMDIKKIEQRGWQSDISIKQGIQNTVENYFN